MDSIELTGKMVALFLPISSKRELNTYHLIKQLKERKISWCIPITDTVSWEMSFYKIKSLSHVSENSLGIPEPVGGELISPEKIDICITPLLAHDCLGNRIGYGKGCYDRFFTFCKPSLIKIGITIFDQPINKIKEDPTDIKLDCCITPFSMYEFKG